MNDLEKSFMHTNKQYVRLANEKAQL